jgi:adenosylcobinamide amidohydrolase
MLLHQFGNKDQLIRQGKAVIARFAGRRHVLSTAPHLGGYREDLLWVFNHDCTVDGCDLVALKATTYAEHMAMIAAELGLDPDRAAGISTAASMDNLSIRTQTWDDTTVTAAVTAGIDVNGGRAGDQADWHESDGSFVPATRTIAGTINILLFISASLTDGALARALVTCTEAKTAALQELLAPSRFSSGLATGSGTDGTIVVSDAESDVHLTEAGKHSKLGELIGRTVRAAVKEALFRQTGLCAERQFSVLARMGRFGVTKEHLQHLAWQNGLTQDQFTEKLAGIDKNPSLVVQASLYAHLLDQLQWGLIRPGDVLPAALALLQQMQMDVASDWTDQHSELVILEAEQNGNSQSVIRFLVDVFRQGLIGRVLEEGTEKSKLFPISP